MAERERFEVAADEAGLRLDQVLARRVPGLSRRKARVLIDIGGVFVDKARVKVASRAVRAGQVVEANLGGALDRASGLGAAARARDAAALPDYRIVFEDADVIVVDKPAGLVTAPTPESDRGNLVDLLARRPGAGPVFLVHRIDLPTSGLLVFARTPEANRALGERFVRHDVDREYRAVVAGRIADDRVTIDRPVGGRRGVTHVEVVERFADATLVAARLETGRTHQIRLHLAGLGHPVLGDAEHGGERARLFAPRPPRLALHAARLGFVHPRTGEALRFDSPIPAEVAKWIDGLRSG
jgi:23S rRNA pseudouridine1911/1915/1917 synthase